MYLSSSTLLILPFCQVYSPRCPQSLTLHHFLPCFLVAPKIAHEPTKMFSCSIMGMVCSPFRDSQLNTIRRNQLCLLPSSGRPFLLLRTFYSLGWVAREGGVYCLTAQAPVLQQGLLRCRRKRIRLSKSRQPTRRSWLRGTCSVVGIGVRLRGVWLITSGCVI